MQFIAPDTLLLENSRVDVAPGDKPGGRLRFVAAGPNPCYGRLQFSYEVPPPGGRVRARVYDISGRLVTDLFDQPCRPGVWPGVWDARDRSGRVAPAGIYLFELRMGGQTVVRRIALAR